MASAVPSSGCSVLGEVLFLSVEGVLGTWGDIWNEHSPLSTAVRVEWCLLCQQLQTQKTLLGASVQLKLSEREGLRKISLNNSCS